MMCVAGVGTGCPYLNRLMFFSLTRMSSTMGYTLHLIRSRTQLIPASSRQCLFCKCSSHRQQCSHPLTCPCGCQAVLGEVVAPHLRTAHLILLSTVTPAVEVEPKGDLQWILTTPPPPAFQGIPGNG